MTADNLTLISGVVISLFGSYFPGFSRWFDTLSPNLKRLFMLAILFITSFLVFVLSCSNYLPSFEYTVTCDQEGALGVFRVFIAALIANQATYAISPTKK